MFRRVQPERLLIETDAPDQLPPSTLDGFLPLTDSTHGRAINHPANLSAIYVALARHLGQPVETLAPTVEANFLRFFS